jgi:hypothetical protein
MGKGDALLTERIMLTLSSELLEEVEKFKRQNPKLLSIQDALRELIANGLEQHKKEIVK